MRKLIFLSLATLLGGCLPGTTARPAQTLARGEVELSGGVVSTGVVPSPLAVAAVGLGDRVDTEARFESLGGSALVRYQVMQQESSGLDATTWTEVGAGDDVGFFFGGGAVASRRFNSWEPYLSYRYRHAPNGSFSSTRILDNDLPNGKIRHIHYIHAGTRYYLGEAQNWFGCAELGANFPKGSVFPEFAFVIGRRL